MNISRRKFVLSAALLLPISRLTATDLKSNVNYFLQGVASGDPLQDCVIIWTRVTPTDPLKTHVKWEISTDPGFSKLIKEGQVDISAHHDYTVKVDVKGLKPGCKYHYRFLYQGTISEVGETQTLPEDLKEGDFTMAVLSCNNWEDGYFNSFRFLAQKTAVDLVLHLGDYIYEYETGAYGNPASGRINVPKHEIVTLQDYRARYAQYRTDPDLQLLHAKKPFYLIWDDHELANDAYKDGAKNHQPNEGKWSERKKAAIQAYLEWMPIRADKGSEVRRKFDIGEDISLYLMDERSSDRTQQMENDQPGFNGADRVIIGESQYNWLAKELKSSQSIWKLIGNQVMFSGYAVAEGFRLPKYNDWWLGYPAERARILDMLDREKIQNTVFLTGDHHESFVLAVHKEAQFMKYTKSHKQKPLAWELLTPSITSRNGDRRSKAEINDFEKMLQDKNINPHLVFADIKSHGYFIATINKKRFRTDYYFVDNILTNQAKEYKAATFTIDATTFGIS
ncbi:alkaline phosphatase [Pedobacter sp. MC2016-24]|uniref:alkaline phosphatase D family protein n=1 Tax=Pedobacter sp. MC2016-24 TaxID=2780090 RepID=UPI00187EF90C|nr:alkaline phosphatase D family protein [Pedobacter sp. MC2016-24]MBE9601701.1 alkaline phosphatase D family protein [Pedobacter sp. MC2016-24]